VNGKRHHGFARRLHSAIENAAAWRSARSDGDGAGACRASLPSERGRGEEPLTFGMDVSVLHAQLSPALLDGGGRRRPRRRRAARCAAAAALYGGELAETSTSMRFCVGAPWNSVAVDLGIGHILHFVSEIFARAAEKFLGVAGSDGRTNTRTC